MRIYPRGIRGILWADFTVDGERFTRSTRTTDPKAAEEWAAHAAADLWRQKQLGEKPRVTFGQATLDWLQKHADERRSIEDMKDRLRWLCERIGDDPLPVRPARLNTILAQKEIDDGDTRRPPAAGTLNRYVAEVSKIHHHAHCMQWIDAVPAFRRYQEPKQAARWLTREQADRLLAELPDHLRNMAQFALATGLRESNVRLLRWAQVDLGRGVAWVLPSEAKNERALSVPLNADAIAVLMRQRNEHDEWVFTFERVTKATRTRAPVCNCSSHAWYKATKRAGLEGIRWHDLRHTWATWHVMNGTPLPALQQLGGWSSYSMVLRYAHVTPDFAAQYANGSLRDKSVTSGASRNGAPMPLLSQEPEHAGEKMGWLTGLEPATTGITIRDSTS
jgi:integrase